MKKWKMGLVIDDDSGMAQLVSNFMHELKVQAIVCGNAEDACNMRKLKDFAVAFVDIFMPGMGGIEGIRSLKQKNPDLLVVAMSGGWRTVSGQSAIRAAQKIGADMALCKPFTFEEFKTCLDPIIDDDLRSGG